MEALGHQKEYEPRYWIPAVFEQMRVDWYGHAKWLGKLRWIEYNDPFMEGTKERKVRERRAYHSEYYKEQRAAKHAEKLKQAVVIVKEFENGTE